MRGNPIFWSYNYHKLRRVGDWIPPANSSLLIPLLCRILRLPHPQTRTGDANSGLATKNRERLLAEHGGGVFHLKSSSLYSSALYPLRGLIPLVVQLSLTPNSSSERNH